MSRVIRCLWILVALLGVTGTLYAQDAPERSAAVAAKAFRHADFSGEEIFQTVDRLPTKAAVALQRRLVDLGVEEATARLDARTGRFATLMPTTPLIPGNGVGNYLVWTKSGTDQEEAAWEAFYAYLEANQDALGVDPAELAAPRLASHGSDMIQIHAPRQIDGILVRDSHVSATIKKGNLILFGAQKWSDRGASSNRPQLTREEAAEAALNYLSPLEVSGSWGADEQVYLTLLNAAGSGQGYRYQLAWSIKVNVAGDGGSWEALVNAHTGEVLAFEDQNHYAEAKGGVYPTSNDGISPDGVEVAGEPMPFMFVGSATTDTGGNYSLTGSQTATFNGPYVNMADNCGTDSLTQSGGIDWGTSGGDDCTTPGFGGAGNTHSSRTGFYELNKLKEMARGQLPSNTWLQNRLTANMNINNTCNAFWNGSTVNFYRSGNGCANTGEIAGVFDHEWAHGMDANDVNGGIASPSGEGIADIYMALRLNTSCIGRGFRPGVNCSGNGDPCLDCTGVRDIDYLKKASGQPHDYSWSNSTCGGQVHCVGHVYSEAVWSLWKRNLQSAPYNFDNNTAQEIVTRLTFIAAGNTSTWFSGGPPNGGCSGSSGYNNFLAADDDNGSLTDGTPHMTAIYNAFNDQEIACQSPTPQDSGCSGAPTSAPNVTATGGNNSVDLSWGSVSGATKYQVFRTEGVFACDFGKVKLGETTGTSWGDSDLQNGRDYSYVVIPIGGDDTCMGPASACDTVAPVSGPECVVDADCDDGLFCNGAETCNAGACLAGSDPCGGAACDEVNDVCLVCSPKGTSCTQDSDCCSNKCKGKPGSQTCK